MYDKQLLNLALMARSNAEPDAHSLPKCSATGSVSYFNQSSRGNNAVAAKTEQQVQSRQAR